MKDAIIGIGVVGLMLLLPMGVLGMFGMCSAVSETFEIIMRGVALTILLLSLACILVGSILL